MGALHHNSPMKAELTSICVGNLLCACACARVCVCVCVCVVWCVFTRPDEFRPLSLLVLRREKVLDDLVCMCREGGVPRD